MKHIKEFQLNEIKRHDYRYSDDFYKNIDNINLETIKNILIGQLTEDFEYTDNVWTNPDVQTYLTKTAKTIFQKIQDSFQEISHYYGSEYSGLNMAIDEIMGIK